MDVRGAGWFADPSGEPQQRYWDGVQWTQQTRPYPPPTPSTPEPSTSPQRPEPRASAAAPKKSPAAKWIIGIAAAVVAVAAVVGLQVSQRHAIDDAAREAARKGANLGGPANAVDTMYDILCPDGPATDAPEGVNCER